MHLKSLSIEKNVIIIYFYYWGTACKYIFKWLFRYELQTWYHIIQTCTAFINEIPDAFQLGNE